MIASTQKDAADGDDVGVVAAPGNGDVVEITQLVVGGVDIYPADALAAINGDPSMRLVCPNQPCLADGGVSAEITADVFRAQP